MLKFNIRNQQLSRVDSFRPVEKSVNYLTASFNFLTKDWEGCTKKATCKNATTGKTYDAAIVKDTCLIPWEALTDKGSFEISVRGTNGETTITTSTITVDLGRTLPSGAETNPPTPNELDLIRKSIGNLDELQTKAKANLVDAINELAQKGGGVIDPEEVERIVAEYLTENPLEETDPTVPNWAKRPEKPTYTADEVGALSAEALPGAVNDALAQAKASGEFDGKDGQDGYTPQKGIDYFDGVNGKDGYTPVKGFDYFDGKDGKDGYTPVKGVDYFDGVDGQPGKNGVDGVSASHEWNGTVLTITSANGTSSADLKGEKGDPGKDGSPGKDGADGYTPIKGIDYYTEADKQEMVATVTADLADGLTLTDQTTGTNYRIYVANSKLTMEEV